MKSVNQIIHKKLGKHKAVGLAYKEEGVIFIEQNLKGINHLETLIHEIVHIQNPKWSEIKVKGHSAEMAKLLWDNNYRKVEF
jgi:hypothetical protein